jgi:UDP-glucose 4-epimerase
VPYNEAYETGFEDMQRRVPDTEKIKRIVGWKPRMSLDETLDEIIHYFRDQQASDSPVVLPE